jgi:hypothetical protein
VDDGRGDAQDAVKGAELSGAVQVQKSCWHARQANKNAIYNPAALVQADRAMRKVGLMLTVLGLCILVVGCASTLITNLTPSEQPRNPTGQYLVEMQLDTRQQTLRMGSVSPAVVIGFNEYKMRPTPKVSERWETYVPVPAGETIVRYHFKVDYEYNRFGQPGRGSLMSQEYKLTIK